MKSSKLILIMMVFAGFLQSCTEKFLDLKEPIKPTLETYYTDTITAYNGLVGCYNSLQMVPSAERPLGNLFIPDIRSDDVDYGGNPKGASEENNYYNAAGFANFDIYSDNSFASVLWRYGYRGVNTINKYLEGISVISLTPSQQVLIDQYKAEAKFMRAYFYFTLVKNFGDVPLYTKTLDQPDWFTQRRILEKEVYAQIFTDLHEAIPLLPVKSKYNPISQASRITKGAAQALLAKTLVTQAGVDVSSPNWTEAYDLCKEIEISNQYNLNTNFKDIFTNAGQYSNEVVFDIVLEESIKSENDSYIHYLSPRFVFINGKPDQSRKMEFGFGVSAITEELANLYGYNQDGDSLSYVNMNDIRGRYTFWARWDRYCGYSVVDKLNARPETKNVENVDDGNYYGRKYNREALATNYSTAGSNYHVIRYAEVLLKRFLYNMQLQKHFGW